MITQHLARFFVTKIFKIFIAVFLLLIFTHPTSLFAATNISSVNKYAEVDFDGDQVNEQVNFAPTNGGVTVSSSGTTGFAFGETVGWINTNPTNGNVSLTCNGNVGTFSGNWWSSNGGSWIALDPNDYTNTSSGLMLNAQGQLEGQVWVPGIAGWMIFDCNDPNRCVETSYTCGDVIDDDDDNDDDDNTSGGINAQCNVSVSPNTISPGGQVTLSWSTNIQQGQYTQAEIAPLGNINGDAGSMTVTVNQTTTFNGSFKGNFRNGTAKCSTTLTVNQPTNPVVGCMDINALNFNPQATISNGICSYINTPPVTPQDPEDTNTTNNNDSTSSSQNNISPFTTVRIEKRSYTGDEQNNKTIIIRILREGSSVGPLRAILKIEDVTAQLGIDIDALSAYSLYWPNGDMTPRSIVLNIITDNETEIQESLLARLDAVIGGTIDPQGSQADIFINDGTSPTNPLAVLASALLIASTIPTLPFRIQGLLLAIPAYRRRRHTWGTVYDARSGAPVDFAEVKLFDEYNHEVASVFTKADGTYGFMVDPGTYYVKVIKPGFLFPALSLHGKDHDETYSHLYYGELFDVTDRDEPVEYNVPLEARIEPISGTSRPHKISAWKSFFARNDLTIHRIMDVLFVIGFGLSLYVTLRSPNLFNYIILSLYGFFILLGFLQAISSPFGKISTSDKSLLPGTMIRAINAETNTEVARRIVNHHGVYSLVVPNGKYFVQIESPDQHQQPFTSKIFSVRHNIIKKNFSF